MSYTRHLLWSIAIVACCQLPTWSCCGISESSYTDEVPLHPMPSRSSEPPRRSSERRHPNPSLTGPTPPADWTEQRYDQLAYPPEQQPTPMKLKQSTKLSMPARPGEEDDTAQKIVAPLAAKKEVAPPPTSELSTKPTAEELFEKPIQESSETIDSQEPIEPERQTDEDEFEPTDSDDDEEAFDYQEDDDFDDMDDEEFWDQYDGEYDEYDDFPEDPDNDENSSAEYPDEDDSFDEDELDD